MLKFFVHHVSRIAIYFHQFHSSKAPCCGLRRLPSGEHVWILFCFRKVLRSSLEMHFLAHVMLAFQILIHVKNSKNGSRRVSPGQQKRLSGVEGSNHRGESENNTKNQKKARETKEEEKRKAHENGDAEASANRGKQRKQIDKEQERRRAKFQKTKRNKVTKNKNKKGKVPKETKTKG
jgi:hypothetical protein